jgi:lysophospholipase L1-like esterase
MPKVLLLGDSIRMSYQPLVADLLADEAEVVGPDANGAFSLFTLTSIPGWIGQLGRPDVIHWNNGIHDAGYNPRRSPVQIPLVDYVGNLRSIIRHIRDNLTPWLIFATSTPPHPDKPFKDEEWAWKHGDIERYNEAALEVMDELKVPVNDLYALVSADLDTNICDDQLHLSETGKTLCADAVTGHLRNMLKERAAAEGAEK